MTPSLFATYGRTTVGRAVVRGRGDQHLRSVVNKVHASFVRIRVGDCAGGRAVADDGVDGDGANITSLRDRVGWRYRLTNLVVENISSQRSYSSTYNFGNLRKHLTKPLVELDVSQFVLIHPVRPLHCTCRRGGGGVDACGPLWPGEPNGRFEDVISAFRASSKGDIARRWYVVH